MDAANIEYDTIQIPPRKFKIGDIAYQVTPKDDGGLLIDRHEVAKIGWAQQQGTFMDEITGEMVKRDFLASTINSREMDDETKYEFEIKFVTLEELNNEVLKNLNRKKLW